MDKKKVAWLLGMAALCLVLYTIVISRVDNRTSVIFGDKGTVQSDSVSFVDPNATPTPEPTENIWPDIDIQLPQYVIVSEDHLLSSAYIPEGLETIKGYKNLSLSSMACGHLNDFMDAIREAGFSVVVSSAYRSYSYQAYIYNGASQGLFDTGEYETYADAAEAAKKRINSPGASEHQLGLAVDLMDRQYNRLIYSNMNKAFFEWVDAHCAEYGFIKRYPTEKCLLTGWDEPWHYRYVGVEAATFIMEHNLCYEQFYQHYDPDFTY